MVLILLVSAAGFSQSPFSINIETGFKYLQGETQEIVYDTVDTVDYAISKLHWNEQVMLVGGDASIFLYDLFFVSGSAWSNVETGSSTMDNYDWLGYYSPFDETGHDPSEWTHMSHSTTEMNLEQYDARVGIRSPKLFGFLSATGAFGFKKEHYTWNDKLLYSIYSSGGDEDGFRDIETEYDGNPAVKYDVSITMPYGYLGLTAEVKMISITVFGEYSNAVDIVGTDNHLLRKLIFIDSFENATYYSVGGDISWNITSSCFLSAGGKYSLIPEGTVGDTVVWNDLEKETYDDDAGFRKEEWEIKVSFGISY